MSRGPAKSGFNPSKEQYRCPVQNCNSEFLWDEITGHFTENANLALLCELFSPPDEFWNFYDSAGSVLDSQHYIHPWVSTFQFLNVYSY